MGMGYAGNANARSVTGEMPSVEGLIQGALQGLQQEVEATHVSLDSMLKRLTPISHEASPPPPESPTEHGSQMETSIHGIATIVRNLRTRIDHATQQVAI